MIKNKRCVLVADSDKRMVNALKEFFGANGFVVYDAYGKDEALKKYYEKSAEIDMLLLDVKTPEPDGFAVLRELRDDYCLVPVIMLIESGKEYEELKGFRCGADDFIAKPISPSVMLAKVEAVLKRFGKAPSGKLKAGAFTIDTDKKTVKMDGKLLKLTRREYDLLLFLAANADVAYSREQLLDSVWGYDFEGGIRTVDTHIKQLRSKLGEHAKCLKTVHCMGYKFDPDK